MRERKTDRERERGTTVDWAYACVCVCVCVLCCVHVCVCMCVNFGPGDDMQVGFGSVAASLFGGYVPWSYAHLHVSPKKKKSLSI